MKSARLYVGLALSGALLCGCGGAHLAGRPKRSLERERVIAEFEGKQDYSLSQLVDDYYAEGASEADKVSARNKIVDISIILMDQHYSIFIEEFSGGKKAFDSTMDIGSMATDAVAVITTPALTKSILAAISGGLTAAKISIDKNYLYDQTIHVLIKQMEAGRRAAIVDLVDGGSKSTLAYPLSAALADLERYYFAGTFDGALSGIQENSSQEQIAADARLELLQDRIESELRGMQQTTDRARAVIAADPTARAAMMRVIERAAAAMSEGQQARFVGIVSTVFDAQLRRSPQDEALAVIAQDEDFWSDLENALSYLRNQADDEAFAKAVGDISERLGVQVTPSD